MHGQMGNVSREMNTLKTKEISRNKNTVPEMKNAFLMAHQ